LIVDPQNTKASNTRGAASAALVRLAKTARERRRLTIGDALASTGEASFGFVLLILALPALIPIPGPFGLIFGSAMAIVALQFAIGAGSLWLPAFLRDRRISASAFVALQRYADPIVRRLEHIIRSSMHIVRAKANHSVARY
jgi:hypothetical protein